MSLELVYIFTGAIVIVFGLMTILAKAHPRGTRAISGSFWLLLGVTFVAGKFLPPAVTGAIILVMVALDATGRVGRATVASTSQDEQTASANRLGNRVFIPVLLVPVMTLVLAIFYRLMQFNVSQGALIGLAVGGVAAMVAAIAISRAGFGSMMQEGRRLCECMARW